MFSRDLTKKSATTKNLCRYLSGELTPPTRPNHELLNDHISGLVYKSNWEDLIHEQQNFQPSSSMVDGYIDKEDELAWLYEDHPDDTDEWLVSLSVLEDLV